MICLMEWMHHASAFRLNALVCTNYLLDGLTFWEVRRFWMAQAPPTAVRYFSTAVGYRPIAVGFRLWWWTH